MALPKVSGLGFYDTLTINGLGFVDENFSTSTTIGTPSIKHGSTAVTALYHGSTQITKVYVGSTQVFGS